MRVLHIYSGNLYGGVETMLVTMARHQELCPEMEADFALCFEDRLRKELLDSNALVHLLGKVRFSRPLTILRARGTLRRLLKSRKFDVIICHSVWTQALFGSVVRAMQLPLVFWLHDAANGRHWLEKLARRTSPDLVLCNSNFTAGTVAKLYPDTAVELLHYPIAAPRQHYSESERNAVRDEFNTPREATVIIQVSRLEPYKGHAFHLEALGQISKLPNWFCWLVGGAQRPQETNYLEELKTIAARLGIADRVRFVGQRSDVSRLLAAADIHCQPNEGPEPFGITFIEALYARLPVVTTAIGGACEIVDDSCGILVAPGDTQALAASLTRLIQDGSWRKRLGVGGPGRAEELCGPAGQLRRLYRNLSKLTADAVPA